MPAARLSTAYLEKVFWHGGSMCGCGRLKVVDRLWGNAGTLKNLIDESSANFMAKANNFDAILLLSTSRWDQDLSSAAISLAREFSRNHRVFFIDQPYTLKDVIKDWKDPRVKNKWKAFLLGSSIYRHVEPQNKNLIVVTPLITLPINWLPKGFLYGICSRINNWIFSRTLVRIVREYKLLNYIFFNSYNPFYGVSLPETVKPDIYIYQSRDNIKESEYVSKHGPALEQRALRRADMRLATSRDLVAQLSTPEYPFILFPNAADVELFSKAAENSGDVPEEIREISRPVIGYVGNICLRIDYDLLYKIATGFPDWTLLLVGPRNDARYHSYNFDGLKNVVFAGRKNLKDLPRYLKSVDCAILPFKVNALTRSIYPLKVNEYLAAGKPVVSTCFSPDIESFNGLVYLGKDHDSFLNSIRKSVEINDEQKKCMRMQAAKQNSWPARVQQFWNLIETGPDGTNFANQQ